MTLLLVPFLALTKNTAEHLMQKIPTKIQLHKKSNLLELHFHAQIFHLSAEYLRVYSPSAEVKGHGPNQAVLQHGKQDVGITTIEKAGNYALKIFFDDGHETGLFSWDYLYELGENADQYWQDYVQKLEQAGKSREKNTSVVKFIQLNQ